jgi:hypothetical protein
MVTKSECTVHDEQEASQIREILEVLPQDHPARKARESGAGTITLIYMVDRKDVAERLTKAWLDGCNRSERRQRIVC